MSKAVLVLALILSLAVSAHAGSVTGGGSGSGTISSGTTNTLPKYTGSTTVGNSTCSDDGTTVTCTATGGVTAPQFNTSGSGVGLYAAKDGSDNVIALHTGSGFNYCADAGASDTYACSVTVNSVSLQAYATGVMYSFKANTANTGAASINFNSLGAKTIKKVAGGITTDLADNDIRVGQVVDLKYDGTNMQMQSTLGNSASGAPTDATYVTLSTNGSLSNERVLTGTANQIVVTDNGAGGTVVLSTPQDLATTSTPTFGAVTVTAGGGSATGKVVSVACRNTTQQATTGTVEEVLAVCQIPASTLNANGQILRVSVFFSLAANANNKTPRLRIGAAASGTGGTLIAGGTADTANNLGLALKAEISRMGSNLQRSWGLQYRDSAGPSGQSAKKLALTDTAIIDITVTGTTATQAGDLTFENMTVELVP